METNIEEITKDSNIEEIIKKYPKLTETFFEQGMHCIGCYATLYETIEQGAIGHGIDSEFMVKQLNEDLKRFYKDEPKEYTSRVS